MYFFCIPSLHSGCSTPPDFQDVPMTSLTVAYTFRVWVMRTWASCSTTGDQGRDGVIFTIIDIYNKTTMASSIKTSVTSPSKENKLKPRKARFIRRKYGASLRSGASSSRRRRWMDFLKWWNIVFAFAWSFHRDKRFFPREHGSVRGRGRSGFGFLIFFKETFRR